MDTKRTRHPDSRSDAQARVLLDRFHESASIIDSLMAMPMPGEDDAAPEWDEAATRRLERKLAEAMRSMIGTDEPERRSA